MAWDSIQRRCFITSSCPRSDSIFHSISSLSIVVGGGDARAMSVADCAGGLQVHASLAPSHARTPAQEQGSEDARTG